MLNERIVASFIYVSPGERRPLQFAGYHDLLTDCSPVLRFGKHLGIKTGVSKSDIGALGSFTRRWVLHASLIRHGQVPHTTYSPNPETHSR